MTPKEYAGWLADKIPAYGDYAKEAALLLRKQADEIERLRNGLQHMVSLYESEQDHETPSALRPEWLKALLVPNA